MREKFELTSFRVQGEKAERANLDFRYDSEKVRRFDLGGSLVIALVFGSILSVIVCRRLDAVNHCITLVLPWLFLLALVVVLAIIYLIFTVYAKSELKKTSILSAIREE